MFKELIFVFIIAIFGGVFGAQILWPYFVERPLFFQYQLNPAPIIEKKEIIIQENDALQDAVEKVKKTVIGVRTENTQGSGLILTRDGLTVTLAGLVPAGSDFHFFTEGKKRSYQILKRSVDKNLALVELEGDDLFTVDFADIDNVRLGERVFSIRIEFIDPKNTTEVVDQGIVKSIERGVIYLDLDKESSQGSVLFNIKGEVIGIVSADKAGQIFVIPIAEIKKFAGLGE